ncbi:alpha/beta fold hydrolase [soil metagenome]
MSLDLHHIRAGSGDPVLLVHSLGGTVTMWEPVLEAIAAQREVIAVDMPGFGDSPAMPGDVRPSARNLASAVLDFYDSLGIGRDPVVSGISLGGWMAIEAGRLGRARGVVGLCTAGFWGKPLGPKRSVARVLARLASPLAPRLTATPEGRRRVLGNQVRHTERMSSEQATAMIRGYAHASAYQEANDEMRSNVIGDLSDVRAPLTLAWAEHDTLVRRTPLSRAPAEVRQLVMPDAGHIPTWDQPELVTDLILAGDRVAAPAR